MWEFLEGGDFISLVETWVEEKQIEYIEKRLSSKWWWEFVPAVREKKKGRAKGGFLLEARKEWVEKEGMVISIIDEGLVKTELATKEGKWTIWTVYNGGKIEDYWKLWEKMDYMEEGTMLIGGDFNIRIGEVEGLVKEV